jgi:hypothetical protein
MFLNCFDVLILQIFFKIKKYYFDELFFTSWRDSKHMEQDPRRMNDPND